MELFVSTLIQRYIRRLRKDLFTNSPHAVVNLCYADSMFVSLQLP